MMKSVFLMLALTCACPGAYGEGIEACPEFWRLIREGDSLKDGELFMAALNKYNTAQTYCRTMADTAQARIDILFDKIDRMRLNALAQKDSIEVQKEELRASYNELRKTSKLAFDLKKAIYFYDNKYGLVQEQGYGQRRSFFVDTAGRKVDFLGMWWSAGPFVNGYAHVQNPVRNKDRLADSLLDIYGNRYSLAVTVERLDANATALNESRRRDPKLPPEIFSNTQLRILILNTIFGLKIPPQITALKNLIHLDISFCDLKPDVPAVVAQLKSLKTLYLSANYALERLPKSISGLESLEGLYIDHTRIAQLPADIGDLKNLKVLDIRRTNIKTLPSSIARLRNFERLFMSPRQLSDAERAKIAVPYELIVTDD